MKYSYECATWWLAISTVPKPYDGVLSRTDSAAGQEVSGRWVRSSRGLALMRAHLAAAADPVGLTSGTTTFRMTAAMAARRRLLDGAVGTSEKGVAVLMNGRMGQRQAAVGLGPSGNVPSTMPIPGHPGCLLSGVSSSSAALAGKSMMM